MEMTSGSTIQVACTSKYKPSQIPNDDHAGMSTRFYDDDSFDPRLPIKLFESIETLNLIT